MYVKGYEECSLHIVIVTFLFCGLVIKDHVRFAFRFCTDCTAAFEILDTYFCHNYLHTLVGYTWSPCT